jgi:hypothetical protein
VTKTKDRINAMWVIYHTCKSLADNLEAHWGNFEKYYKSKYLNSPSKESIKLFLEYTSQQILWEVAAETKGGSK